MRTLPGYSRLLAFLLLMVAAAGVGAQFSAADGAGRITALNIGAPGPALCNGNQAMSSVARDALPGAWRNPARYGTGWDLHRDDQTGLMSVTWYTFDAARRPVWYRSAVAQIDPITMTWRASIESARLERGVAVEPAPIGAVAIRFIKENPGKIAIRWSLDRKEGPPLDECLIDAFGESRDAGTWRAQRLENPSSGDYEIVRTPLQSADFSGERLVMLGFDSSGASVWTVGVQPSQQSGPIPLSYYYSNYPGGVPSTSCAHQGCVSAPRPAGTLTQSGRADMPAVDIAVSLSSAEVGQSVQFNRAGNLQQAAATNALHVSPAGNCTLAPGVTSCQKTVAWFTSVAGARTFRLRTDTNPVQELLIGTASSGSQVQMLTAGRWKFVIRRNDAMQSVIVSSAEIVVGNGTPPPPNNTIGFRPMLECRNSSAGITPGLTPGISGRWWNSQRDSTGWDLVFTEPTSQYPNGTLIATWNTFGNNAEPVWLIAPTMQIEAASEAGQTVKRAWGQLSRYTWNAGTDQATSVPVGEVAFTFDPMDATRASLRWKWSEAPAQPFYEECVSEFSRAAAPAQAKNQAFSGSWYEPQLPGYGYSVYLASGPGNSLVENQVLNAYDTAGQPRWVIGTTTGPTTAWTDVPLSYLRSNFAGGVPTSNCSGDACRTVSAANKLSRMFTGDAATASAKVEAYYTGNGVTFAWYRIGNPPSPVAIAKVARTDEIVVNRQLCTVTSSACEILVSWTSTRAEARAYRVNLATGSWTMLDPQSAVASRSDSFSSGGRFRYVLAVPGTPELQTVASSAEVVITGQLPAPSGTLSTNSPCSLPGSGSNPNLCTVQMTVTLANTPWVCVWNRDTAGLHACWQQNGVYPHAGASLTPLAIELRAHAINPTSDPGWPGNSSSQYNAAPLLASATIVGANTTPSSIVIAANPSSNLVAPATTRLSATISSSSAVQQVVYQRQGQNICAPATVAPYNCDWTGITAGSYSITGVATLASSQITSTPINLTVSNPVLDYVPPSLASMATSDAVGATTGNFRVSESGDATYTIPIYTAPASGGTGPQMALAYSSGSPFGIAGAGWSVQGASSISRCRKTSEHGDIVNHLADQPSVALTAADAYCLDGQRLIALPNVSPGCTSGAAANGTSRAAQAEYRTEIESYRRICAWTEAQNVGGGHAYFTVHGKDGTISVYGRDQWSPIQGGYGAASYSSRLLANAGATPRAAITWMISRVEDTAGNYFDYQYSKDEINGEQYLSEVRYNANRRVAGQTPDHSIVFNYDPLPADEIEHGRVATATTRTAKILSSIHSTGTGSQSLRHYRLRYNPTSVGERRTLAGVTECSAASSPATCYPETVFTWTVGTTSFASSPNTSGAENGFEGLAAEKFGDINGDGLTDIIWVKRANSGDPGSNLEAFWITTTVMSAGVPEPGTGKHLRKDTEIPFEASQGSPQRSWHVLDYNGDGRDDLLRLGLGGRTVRWFVHLSIPNPDAPGYFTFDPYGNDTGIATQDDRDVMVLSDFTGDGLADALVAGESSGALNLFLYPMERSQVAGQPFRFGASIPVNLDSSGLLLPGDPGDRTSQIWSFGRNMRALNKFQPMDVNADGRSDLSAVLYTVHLQGPICAPRSPAPTTAFLSDAELDAQSGNTSKGSGSTSHTCYIPYPAVLKAKGMNTNGEFEFVAFSPRIGQGCFVDHNGYVSGTVAHASIQHGDFSGDGYADVLFKQFNPAFRNDCTDDQEIPDTFAFQLNQGNSYSAPIEIGGLDPLVNTDTQDNGLQFLDVNGDARADLVYPRYFGDEDPGNRYKVRYWTGTGFASATEFPGPAARGEKNWKAFLVDLDNDGWVEGLRLKTVCSSAPCTTWKVLPSANRAVTGYKPQQRMSMIITGLEAATVINYAPLSDASVYARGTGSAATAPGRGSPVFDLYGSLYVVKSVQSSAPTATQPNALASIRYFYKGARMQGGGRGFLGFEELHTYADVLQAANPAQRMRTITRYLQAFPFVGAPSETVQELVTLGANGLATGAGQVLSRGTTVYYPVSVPATPQALTVLKQTEEAFAFDLQTGVQISGSRTQYQSYDAYGSVLTMSVANLDAGGATLRTTSTVNTYGDDVPAKWLLGRLTNTQVTHTIGQTSEVRTSAFEYEPDTGLLRGEIVEPGGAVDESLRKAYELDLYGNKVRTAVCSNTPFSTYETCLDTSANAFKNHWNLIGEQQYIKRVGRVIYDSRGRFARESRAWAAPTGVFAEVPMQWTLEGDFDKFGNPRRTYSANGGIAQAQYGPLGREHARWSNDGAATEVRYAWCTGTVTCPANMRYRTEVKVRGGATSWTYHDILGRARVKIGEGYSDPNDPEAAALGFTANEYNAVSTDYDLLGRAVKTSEPYFVQGPNAATPDAPASGATVYWTQTTFDALGRTTRIVLPETGAYTASAIAGLTTTTSTIACAGCDVQTRTETSNYLGQLVETTDANGVKVCNTYDVQGKLRQVDQALGSCSSPVLGLRISVGYNKVGHKTSMVDPDKGSWSYAVNALGEVVQQTDAKGQRIVSSYDAQGRVWRRQDLRADGSSEGIAQFEFDTAANGLGALASESISAGTFTKSYGYDALGRVRSTSTQLDGVSYATSATYDGYGRGDTATDASGDAIRTEFTQRGFAKRMREAAGTASGSIINEIRRVNARGQVVEERRGGSASLTTVRDYYPQTGRLKSILSGGGAIQNLYYEWDFVGNLRFRRDQTSGTDMDERFDYDVLNRLTTVRLSRRAGGPIVTNQVTQSLTYNNGAGTMDIGNIVSKSDVGSYTYGQSTCGRVAGPHAVTTAGSVQYCYDANGNQVSSSDGRSSSYSVFDKPLSITKTPSAGASGDTVSFSYGTGRELLRRTDANGTQVTRFVGGIEVLVNENATRRQSGGAIVRKQGTTRTVSYVFGDHLGSVSAIVDGSGAVQQRQSFDAHGARRAPTSWETWTYGQQLSFDASRTRKGFTGHEGVDATGLIHFGGRMYDPRLGRFIQADPMVEDANLSNGLNRYSYVLNNPLSLTDPTGYLSWSEARPYVAIVVAAVLQQWGAVYYNAIGITSALAQTVVTGAIAGAVRGGSQGAVMGAFSAGLNYGIGNVTGQLASGGEWSTEGVYAASVALHGMRGGVISLLQGGSFGHGFRSAALTEGLSPLAGSTDNVVAQYFISAAVGGTVSELTGGKFANGAADAVFALAFNHLAHKNWSVGHGWTPGQPRPPLDESFNNDTTPTPSFISASGMEGGDVDFELTERRGIYNYDVYVTSDVGRPRVGPYQGAIAPDLRQPNCANGCPSIAAGSYPYVAARGLNGWAPSKRKPMLWLDTVTARDRATPITGAWVHTGYRSGTFAEGCLTVSPVNWGAFIGNFQMGQRGNVRVDK